MARNSTERVGGEYDLELKRSTFPAHLSMSQHNPSKHLQLWYYAGFNWAGILHDPLYCYSTALKYMTYSFVFSSRIVL